MARKSLIKVHLQRLSVGETHEFPAEISINVRSMASTLGFQWNKTFATAIDRERRVISVTRTQ